jgi:hypothetical protein
MVTDMLGVLLQELSQSMGDVQLTPDKNNSCLINFRTIGIKVQVELNKSTEFLIIGCDLGTVTPGRYRESIFKEALKANSAMPPPHAILAFSLKSDHLVLFQKIQVQNLNGERIHSEILLFNEKAVLWTNALKSSSIPSIVTSQTRTQGMFGLRP